MPQKYYGILIAVTAATVFGTFTILVKMAYAAGANGPTILSIRFLLAALLFAVILKLRGLSLRITPRLAAKIAVLGFFFYCGMSFLYVTSLQYLTASIAIMLFYIHPVIIGIVTAVLGYETINLRKAAALFICFAGLFLVLGVSFGSINPTGVALIIGAVVVYVGFMMLSGKIIREADSIVTTTYLFLICGLTFGVYGLVTTSLVYTLPLNGWLAILAITVFPTMIGIWGLLASIRILGATTASVIFNLEPVSTVILAALFLGENITLLQTAGGLLIIVGITLFQWRSAEKKNIAANQY